jgi:hypothetical protein
MKKFKRLAVTVAALAALAVGGAAFAQAQNATVASTPSHQSAGEQASPGDPADSDQGGKADSRGSAAEPAGEQNDGPDSASEGDAPEGPGDPVDGAGQESEND